MAIVIIVAIVEIKEKACCDGKPFELNVTFVAVGKKRER